MRRFLCVIFGIDPVLSVGGLTSRCKIVAAAPTSRRSCKLGRASIFDSLFVVTLQADPSYPIERCGFEYLRYTQE